MSEHIDVSKIKKGCVVAGCDRPLYGRLESCNMHYQRKRRLGGYGPTGPLDTRHLATAERFNLYLTPDPSGCVLWTGTTDPCGYGSFLLDGSYTGAHRAAWILANGPIPAGMEIDHLCHVRNCVNLDHLRLATRSLNMSNLSGPGRRNKTGVVGVSQTPSSTFRAQVKANKKTYYLGSFPTVAEAAEAVAQKRKEIAA